MIFDMVLAVANVILTTCANIIIPGSGFVLKLIKMGFDMLK